MALAPWLVVRWDECVTGIPRMLGTPNQIRHGQGLGETSGGEDATEPGLRVILSVTRGRREIMSQEFSPLEPCGDWGGVGPDQPAGL